MVQLIDRLPDPPRRRRGERLGPQHRAEVGGGRQDGDHQVGGEPRPEAANRGRGREGGGHGVTVYEVDRRDVGSRPEEG